MSIGSGNGLAQIRRQAIIWTNADPVHWRIYAALGGDGLTHWDHVTHICQWTGSSMVQVMACCLMAPSHYLNQCWFIVNQIPRNELLWNLTKDIKLFIQENTSENVISNWGPYCSGINELSHWPRGDTIKNDPCAKTMRPSVVSLGTHCVICSACNIDFIYRTQHVLCSACDIDFLYKIRILNLVFRIAVVSIFLNLQLHFICKIRSLDCYVNLLFQGILQWEVRINMKWKLEVLAGLTHCPQGDLN